jgi:hypothetical protein
LQADAAIAYVVEPVTMIGECNFRAATFASRAALNA